MGIAELLAENETKDLLRFLTAGSVDDGKSTLIGRLLYDSKTVYEDHLRSLEKDSAKGGSAGGRIDYSLLTDGLKAEREQGITIDVAYRFFSTPRRKFIIADTPGHEQYTRNMATGASTADLAILLVDARKGVVDQTRRHSFIASLLGIRHVVVCINKMDLMGYSAEVYERIRRDYADFAARLEVRDLHFMPISALEGDNVVTRSARMPWYDGPSLLHLLETVHIASDRDLIDMRFPVQYVLRQDQEFRGFCGTVASGVLREGDEVLALPAGKRAVVKGIHTWEGRRKEAFPPLAVTVELDREVDVSRGDMLVHPGNLPRRSRSIEAMLVWLAEEPMQTQGYYLLKHQSSSLKAEVESVRYRIDVNSLQRQPAEHLGLNEIGRVRLDLSRDLAHDPYSKARTMGAFVLIDPLSNGTVAAGMILDRESEGPASGAAAGEPVAVRSQPGLVTSAERTQAAGHPSCVVWLTGLPRSGKTSIAYGLERRLFDRGVGVAVLDGENLRLGLSRNLGFGAHERSEHVRRAAHVAKLLADLGWVVVVALVSPFEADREAAAGIVGSERFRLVHLAAPLAVCEARDPSGLYARARSGELDRVSGVTAPYEVPGKADLVVNTHEVSLEESLAQVEAMLQGMGIVSGRGRSGT